MLLLVKFDVDADIIDVPHSVVAARELMRKRFLKWLHNKNVKHKYWVKIPDPLGGWYYGVNYRSDAFVEWINKKILSKKQEKAFVVQQHVDIDKFDYQYPSISF